MKTHAQHTLERTGEFWCRAELFRLLGEYEKRCHNNKKTAQEYFDQAIQDASNRGAMLW